MGDRNVREWERQDRIARQAANDDAVAAERVAAKREFVESEPRIESEFDRDRHAMEESWR